MSRSSRFRQARLLQRQRYRRTGCRWKNSIHEQCCMEPADRRPPYAGSYCTLPDHGRVRAGAGQSNSPSLCTATRRTPWPFAATWSLRAFFFGERSTDSLEEIATFSCMASSAAWELAARWVRRGLERFLSAVGDSLRPASPRCGRHPMRLKRRLVPSCSLPCFLHSKVGWRVSGGCNPIDRPARQ